MGKNELGKVFNMAGRSCLFIHSFGQSHCKHTKTILNTEKNLLENTIRNEKTAANMGFSAMLAEEYILIDISLSAASWCDFSSQRQLKFIHL